jgi:hypothetical protein
MGLLSADLDRHRTHLRVNGDTKQASHPALPSAVESLRSSLERFAGAEASLEKSASDKDHERLWRIHEEVEKAYRRSVKEGRKTEADALLDKFAGWQYLKGMPGEAGDLHPLPAPEEK